MDPSVPERALGRVDRTTEHRACSLRIRPSGDARKVILAPDSTTIGVAAGDQIIAVEHNAGCGDARTNPLQERIDRRSGCDVDQGRTQVRLKRQAARDARAASSSRTGSGTSRMVTETVIHPILTAQTRSNRRTG